MGLQSDQLAGLDDMSRISMGAADDTMNKDSVKEPEPPMQPPITNEWK